ncbi:acyl-CoA dehydrogenase family protein [Nocardioides sp. zg-DK7169]|uniref:acyl-CoA dehydrogenase family protein n=1 Tax=Nocardioides sp. zg-DK7169 TaxID=2736600 RepID=UPI0015517605|nr:acyl-CoA dehydrogenase family protein [Nocardioides sp. zg-DK7169]NPC98293.1 hydroxylase [Nocardioides sp. zg-DK7169]
MNDVRRQMIDHADKLREQAEESEQLCRLPDETAALLRSSGAIRMLQPKEYGGQETHLAEFAETVMGTAKIFGSAGWVQGIVGVHPWQLAFADPRVREEVWGEDQDTWLASPYQPNGRLVPEGEDGFRFSGRWQFSSGTDHCQWIFLGGLLAGTDGEVINPPKMVHVILPRSDYEIVEDSWNTVGLRGTGSKDVIVRDAYVPAYRVMDCDEVIDGTAVRKAGRDETLYKMPWSCTFPAGITSAIIGIAEGALETALGYQRDRINAHGTVVREDPYTLSALGEAAADIHAARGEILGNINRLWDIVDSGREVSFETRALGRLAQVRAAHRAVDAVDRIFARSGGTALRMDHPLQRFWRDAHAGLNHAINIPGPTYHANALTHMGVEPQGALRALI